MNLYIASELPKLFCEDGTELRQIPDFPNYYIAESGAIWSLRRPGAWTSKWLGYRVDAHGRSKVTLSRDSKAYHFVISTLVAASWIGPRSDGMCTLHKDNRKNERGELNNHRSNLYYGTEQDNSNYREQHGATSRGELHSKKLKEAKAKSGYKPGVGEFANNTKQSPEQVLEIKRRLSRGETDASIARLYRLHVMTVNNIKSGKIWSHLTLPEDAE